MGRERATKYKQKDKFSALATHLKKCEELFHINEREIKALTTEEFYAFEDVMRMLGQIADNFTESTAGSRRAGHVIKKMYLARDRALRQGMIKAGRNPDMELEYSASDVARFYQCCEEYVKRYGRVPAMAFN